MRKNQKKEYDRVRQQEPAYKKQKAEYYQKTKAKRAQQRQARKYRILSHYSKGDKPVCAHCGQDNILVLCIDHIAGGGARQRRMLGHTAAGAQLYCWLERNGYPKGYQVLCYNCNILKSFWNNEHTGNSKRILTSL